MANNEALGIAEVVNVLAEDRISEILRSNDEISALVIFGTYQKSLPAFSLMKGAGRDLFILGSLAMVMDDQFINDTSGLFEGGVFLTSGYCYTTKGQQFKDQFLEKYKRIPNPLSSYTFDGINMIIEAVRKEGADRDGIKGYLSTNQFNGGATGSVQFDNHGNRISGPFLVQIIKGHPVILKR